MDKSIELTIDSLTYGGRGVGRHDGKAVFVPLVLPGERVLCRVVRDKKRYCEAELITVLQASPDRRPPLCQFFSDCGGCQWQHLPYPVQLHWKEKIFTDILVRATGCDADRILPIAAAPAETGYRCRAQIRCRMTAQGLIAGFYQTGSHSIVDTDLCPVLDPLIPPLLRRFRSCMDHFPQADKIPQIDFCIDSNGGISLVLHFCGTDMVGLRGALQSLDSKGELNLSIQTPDNRLSSVIKGGAQSITPEDDSVLRLCFPPGGFIQINLQQNRRLVHEVLQNAIVSGRERILDLYAGIGNFSLPLARKCAEVVAVEEYEPGVTAAIRNAADNHLENVRFIAGRSERIIKQLVDGPRFDTIVLDPPRSGAAEVVESLLKLQPDRIVYVSCDPMTLARDLVSLLRGGYRLVSARPIDMFPQTWHIEGIALLEKTK